MGSLKQKSIELWSRLRRFYTSPTLRTWFQRPQEDLTLVLLTKGHLEVRKLRFSPRVLWMAKWAAALGVLLVGLSFVFLIFFLVRWPENSILTAENRSLKKELSKIQFHLDTLQMSVDRMTRFDQKLRALTEVDKEFAKYKGPLGQGGSETEETQEAIYDFGDYKIDGAELSLETESPKYLDREETFAFQRLYSWMKRLYQNSELQEQSLEELFEVLKGRELQLSSTPSILPVQGWVTSHFGYRIDPFTGRRALHRGLDVAARIGTPIIAPAEAVVTFVGPYSSYGNVVMLFHGYGISSLYAHTDELFVKVGQKVKRGDIIGTTGNSGRSTAPHLHYEVIVHGVPVDPRKYVLDRSL